MRRNISSFELSRDNYQKLGKNTLPNILSPNNNIKISKTKEFRGLGQKYKIERTEFFIKGNKYKTNSDLLEYLKISKKNEQAFRNIIELEGIKGNLNNEVNEAKYKLRKLEEKKFYFSQEININKLNLSALKKEKENINNELTEIKNEYNDYEIKLKDCDNIVKNINSKINSRKKELKLKENDINEKIKQYFEKENILKEREHSVNHQQIKIMKDKNKLEKLKLKVNEDKYNNNFKYEEIIKNFYYLYNIFQENKYYSYNIQMNLDKLNHLKKIITKEKQQIEQEKIKIKKEKEYLNEKIDQINKEKYNLKKEKEYLEKEKKEIKHRYKQLFEREKELLKYIQKSSNDREKINKVLKESFNLKPNKNQEEEISDICFLGYYIRNLIKTELKKEPENFINIDEEIKHYKNNQKDNTILALYLLSNWLEENGCKVAIEKKSKDIKLNKLCLQHIFSKKAIEKKYILYFNQKFNNCLYDKDELNNFIIDQKNQLSDNLKISTKDIFLINPRGPDFSLDLYIKNLDENKQSKLKKYIKEQKYEKYITDYKNSILLEGCKLSLELFEQKFDKLPNEWSKEKQLRGNLKYYPPYNFRGFGLKVSGAYDNKDDTWLGNKNKEGEFAVAYYGIRTHLNSKQEANQIFEFDDDLKHPGKKCGRGVYLTPKIEIAESHAKELSINEINKKYKFVFQCKVNPKLIRQSEKAPDYWILNANEQEIRPYRILIKEEGKLEQEEEEKEELSEEDVEEKEED